MRASPRIATSAIMLFLCLGCEAMADVKIVITYTDVENEIYPNIAIHITDRRRELILTNDHKIRSTFDYGYAGKSGTGTYDLGKSNQIRIFTGSIVNSRWVIEKGAIVRIGHTNSSSSTLRISTNGIDSCSATMTYQLNKDHKSFEDKRMSNGEDIKMSDAHAENVTCTISNVSQ